MNRRGTAKALCRLARLGRQLLLRKEPELIRTKPRLRGLSSTRAIISSTLPELRFLAERSNCLVGCARIDKMISDAKPWDLAKDENQRQTLNAVLYRSAEALRWLCVLLYSVMPQATQEIYAQLGSTESVAKANPLELKWGGLAENTRLEK